MYDNNLLLKYIQQWGSLNSSLMFLHIYFLYYHKNMSLMSLNNYKCRSRPQAILNCCSSNMLQMTKFIKQYLDMFMNNQQMHWFFTSLLFLICHSYMFQHKLLHANRMQWLIRLCVIRGYVSVMWRSCVHWSVWLHCQVRLDMYSMKAYPTWNSCCMALYVHKLWGEKIHITKTCNSNNSATVHCLVGLMTISIQCLSLLSNSSNIRLFQNTWFYSSL
jgi:hypothetical protein